jgi:DNA repair protein RecO (recombination protein O)
MHSRTRAIVLKTTKYSDNSLIVKLYTEQFGLKTYIVGGIHGKKSKAALFLPLSLLEIIANHKQNNALVRPKEISCSEHFQQIYADVNKSSMLLFLNEIIYKSIKEEEANQELFDFLAETLIKLENNQDSIANFHLQFLLNFTLYLGFYPNGTYSSSNCYFDLQEGMFTSTLTNYSLDEYTSKLFSDCLEGRFEPITNKETRKMILTKILLFYEYHVHGFTKLKSIDVLYEINL